MKTVNWIHYLRIFAAFAVVGLHVSSSIITISLFTVIVFAASAAGCFVMKYIPLVKHCV